MIIIVKYNKLLSHRLWNEMRGIIILMIYWIKLKKRNETILINQCENLNREGTNEKKASHQHDISTYFL